MTQRPDHRKLAEEEAAAWKAAQPAERLGPHGIVGFWKVRDPQRNGYEVRSRYTLYKAHNELIWKYVEEGLVLKAAAELVLTAKRELRPIEDVLKDYMSGLRVNTDKGYFYRAREESTSAPSAPPPPSPPPLPSEPPPASSTSDSVPPSLEGWPELRAVAERTVRRLLVGEDPQRVDRYIGKFMADVRTAVDDLRRAVHHGVARNISHIKLARACSILNIDPPAPGKAADLVKAKRHRKLLLRDLHPDRHPGDTDKEANFHTVVNAYNTIADYNEQLGRT